MYYKIVKADSSDELVIKVNNSIQAGFVPIGGVAVSTFYSQAMIDKGSSK